MLVAADAVDAPAAACGDLAQFLHIDVHHRAGGVVLVPQHGPHLVPGRRVEVSDAVDAASDHDPVDRHRGYDDAVVGFEDGGEAGCAELGLSAELFYEVFDHGGGPVWGACRGRRAIRQTVRPLGLPAGVPLRQTTTRDPRLGSHVSDRPALVNPLTQPPTTSRRERGIGMPAHSREARVDVMTAG